MTPPLRVYPLPHMASLPARGTPASAGLDLHSCWSEASPVVIRKGHVNYGDNGRPIRFPPIEPEKRHHPDYIAIEPGCVALIPTGVCVAIPVGHEGQVRLRSSTGLRTSLIMPHGVGTIDSDYRDELKVIVRNVGPSAHYVYPGDRLAQLVVAPVAMLAVEVVDSLDALGGDDRGGGFGSTGGGL